MSQNLNNTFARFPRKHKHTNNLSFLGYYQIMKQMQKLHQTPNFTITQHDKDKVSYKDAYLIISRLDKLVDTSSKEYTSKMTKMLLNIDTVLCNKLMSVGAFTKQDVKYIIDQSKKMD